MAFYRRQGRGGAIALALWGGLLWCSPGFASDSDTVKEALASVGLREGALGLVLNHGPEYAGAERSGWGWKPAFYLRWHRWSISNAAGFVNRRADDVPLGLGIDLVEEDDLRVSLGLRIDRGRDESASEALKGLGDTPSTVRARLAGTWQRHDGWRVHGAWNIDALGRGAGWFADIGASREHPMAGGAVLGWGGTLSFAGSRYQQVYYGVDEAQSARSGYPVYEPGAGLREGRLSVSLRSPLGPHWSAMVGLDLTRQLGPAADSPLVQQKLGWSTRAGLAWQF